jgi:hypothetical protein
MDAQTRKLFNIVFQEAHVVDFDFSQWDRRLRLVVVAGLFGENFEGRGPLHNVDFIRVKELSWHANHLGVVLDSPEQHCQWVIMEFQVEKRLECYSIKLSGFGPTPMMEVTCSDVQISELDAGVVDRVNPDWNRPYCPLARPGFEKLLRMLKDQK